MKVFHASFIAAFACFALAQACGFSVIGGADGDDKPTPNDANPSSSSSTSGGATSSGGTSSGATSSSGSTSSSSSGGTSSSSSSSGGMDAGRDAALQPGCPNCANGVCAMGVCKVPKFWVRGDDGVTTGGTFTWADKSGNGNNVSQTSAGLMPTRVMNAVNNHAAVRFDNNARLVGSDVNAYRPGTGDVVWFHVSRNRGFDGFYKNQVFATLIDTDPFSGITAGFGTADRPYGMFRQALDNFIGPTTGAGSLNEWVVMDMRRTGGNAQLRKNGVVIAQGAAAENLSGGALVVGSERATGTEFFNGDIAEIILFGGLSFSDAERSAVAKELGARYGIAVQ